MIKRYGVVEIGTRGVRLLVADASHEGIEQFVFSTGGLSDLGRNADESGNLSKRSIERVSRIVARYIGIAEAKGAEQVFGIATEGVRAAPNQLQLLQALATLIDVKPLSREQEAAYSFTACADAFCHKVPAGASLLAVDQGGGSTELTAGTIESKDEIVLRDFVTLDLGTVTISKMVVEAETLAEAFKTVRQQVRNELNWHPALQSLKTVTPELTVGLGSAITQFMWEVMKNGPERVTSLRDVHGQPIQTSTIAEQLDRIERRLGHYTRDDFGADLYPGSELAVWLSGFLTYYEILRFFDIPEIYVSRNGTRYGALLWHVGKRCKVDLN